METNNKYVIFHTNRKTGETKYLSQFYGNETATGWVHSIKSGAILFDTAAKALKIKAKIFDMFPGVFDSSNNILSIVSYVPDDNDDFSQYINPPEDSEEDVYMGDGCYKTVRKEINETEHTDNETGQLFDPVNNPSHYTDGKYECIDVMIEQMGKDAVIAFCKCNAFKYLWRAGKKEGNSELQDIKKANWYLNKAEELMKEES